MRRRSALVPWLVPRFSAVSTELKVVAVYLLVGFLWIYASDWVIGSLTQDPEQLRFWSTYKGWLFVAVTGALLFWMLRWDCVRLRQTHAHLAESESKFRNIASNIPGVVYQFRVRQDGSTYFSYVSPRAEEILGLSPDPASPDWELGARVHPNDREEFLASTREAVERHTPWSYEGRLLLPDGSIRWFQGISSPSPLGDEWAYDGVLLDITERKEVENALRESEATLEQRVVERTALAEHRANQLRLLAAELTQAEERERHRLARLLHDHLQQILVAGRIKVATLRRHTSDDRLLAMAQQVDEMLTQALDESRSLTASLSPPVLYDRGLVGGLQWLARQTQESYHLTVDLQAEAEAEPAELETRILLFQAVRELLLNIVKHAQTTSASITVHRLEDDRLNLVVADGGVGFNAAELERAGSPSGFGLFSLRERLELIGGWLEVISAPGQGTRVRIEAPLHRTRESSAHRCTQPATWLPR